MTSRYWYKSVMKAFRPDETAADVYASTFKDRSSSRRHILEKPKYPSIQVQVSNVPSYYGGHPTKPIR